MKKRYTLSDFDAGTEFPFCMHIARLAGDFQAHEHTFTELVIILDGRAVHQVGGAEYPLRAGDVFVVHGREGHGFAAVEGLHLCNIMFDSDSVIRESDELRALSGFQSLFVLEPRYPSPGGFQSRLVLNATSLNFVREEVSRLYEEFTTRESGFQGVVKAYFLALAAYLSRQYARQYAAQGETGLSHVHRLAEAAAFIEANYTEPIRLADAAAKAHVSVRHFIRVFKEKYRETPASYIIQLRVRHAARLLRRTSLDITTVALNSGYASPSLFSRQFRSRMGVSPSEFRRIYAAAQRR